jgi:hypothetical protein
MNVDRQRLREELRRMKELIAKDPEVLARFDLDGNGVIDGDEWDQVRELVTKRLEREAREAAEADRLGAQEPSAAALPGSVASAIYEGDLAAITATPSSLAEADEMVLEQQGGLGQLLEGAVRRRYAVFAMDGAAIGTIDQVENEMLQDMLNRSILEQPDLHFRVTDAGTGEQLTFRRTRGLGHDAIQVLDARGRLRATVEWKLSLLGRKFVVEPSGEGGSVTLKGGILRPFTMDVLDCVDDRIGTVERGWSGLGAFLTGGNRMRIRVDPGEVVPNQRLGLLAAALLADLASESHD